MFGLHIFYTSKDISVNLCHIWQLYEIAFLSTEEKRKQNWIFRKISLEKKVNYFIKTLWNQRRHTHVPGPSNLLRVRREDRRTGKAGPHSERYISKGQWVQYSLNVHTPHQWVLVTVELKVRGESETAQTAQCCVPAGHQCCVPAGHQYCVPAGHSKLLESSCASKKSVRRCRKRTTKQKQATQACFSEWTESIKHRRSH